MFNRWLGRAVTFAATALVPSSSYGQACCAGPSAITPGRLSLHEDALVGLQVRAATVTGSFDDAHAYAASPPGASELDFEEDAYGAIRVWKRAQLAVIVPVLETRRHLTGVTEVGGGIGDVNASARYDFTLAGTSRYWPGVAAFAGLTLPTGTPPDRARRPLATDATGTGALQATVGLGLEQTYGPWVLDANAILAFRAARSALGVDEQLAPQLVAMIATAYAFEQGAAVALSLSFATEGDATLQGVTATGTGRQATTLSLSGLLPLGDTWRLQGSIYADPPLAPLGQNLPALIGITFGWVRSWS